MSAFVSQEGHFGCLSYAPRVQPWHDYGAGSLQQVTAQQGRMRSPKARGLYIGRLGIEREVKRVRNHFCKSVKC